MLKSINTMKKLHQLMGKTASYHQNGRIKLTAYFFIEILQARRVWGPIFNILKEKNFQPRISYPAKLSFISKGEIKFFRKKQFSEIS